MAEGISPREIYRLLESFVLWDNYKKKGPWQSFYSKEPRIDPSEHDDALSFSSAYLESLSIGFDEKLGGIAPVLYLIGPTYASKAISELDIAGFSNSGIPPKSNLGKGDVNEVIKRYESLSHWLSFPNPTSDFEKMALTSELGPRIYLQDNTWSFEYGDYKAFLFSSNKMVQSNALRVVDIMLRSGEVPDSGYEYIRDTLFNIYTKSNIHVDNDFLKSNLSNLQKYIGESKYINEVKAEKENFIERVTDKKNSPEEKKHIVRGFCIFIDSKLGGHSTPMTNHPFLLIPRSHDEIDFYIKETKLAIDAFYPDYCFPLSNTEMNFQLENLRFKYKDRTDEEGKGVSNPYIVNLDVDAFKEEIAHFGEGVTYVEIPEEFIEDLSQLGGESTDRVLMNLFGDKHREVKSNLKDFDFKVKYLEEKEKRIVMIFKRMDKQNI